MLVIASSAQGALAQQPADNLTDQQKLGRQVFAQSCGVCHLPPSLGARTYGPALNKDAGGGDNDVMREFVENGTPRMPAFKYYLKPARDRCHHCVRENSTRASSAARKRTARRAAENRERTMKEKDP